MENKERVYCEDCGNWDQLVGTKVPECLEGCKHVISVNYDLPIRPEKVYGDYKVLNKDGKCPHFKGKNEGLGIVGTKEKLL